MIRRRIVIDDVREGGVGGIELRPVAERPFGGALVKITAPGTELDRDGLERLREAIAEALE